MFKYLLGILNHRDTVKKRLALRRMILMLLDIASIWISYNLSHWLLDNFSTSIESNEIKVRLLIITITISVFIYLINGIYRSLSRYLGSKSFYRIILSNILIVLILYPIYIFYGLNIILFKLLLVYWLLFSFMVVGYRIIIRDFLLRIIKNHTTNKSNIAIYGAGVTGAQLEASLRLQENYNVISIVDDLSDLWSNSINGIRIKSPKYLYKISNKLDKVLLAMPSIKNTRRREILNQLSDLQIPVLQVPSMNNITSGKVSIDNLIPIAVEQLLEREPISPDKNLLEAEIIGNNICVTGAGGSVGSELCRQILSLKPKSLVILDISEPSLYSINQELKQYLNKLNIDSLIIPILGSTSESKLISNLFNKYKISTVFHAAAYKHVPLVEENPIQGIYNNTISTKVICEAARINKLKKVVLISTDKAVRPSNVMGATKRLAELIIQAYAQQNADEGGITKFSMVRFGNVLNSSGSVVPLFMEQLTEGGPITLTHKEIIRYFMTIPEAAQLVIQASTLSKGGEVFLLDMGKPISIYDLAVQMIKLSGHSLKDTNNPEGDIEIIITGLRPGEKLYEELLIEKTSKPTKHPLIFSAEEISIDYKVLFPKMNSLEKALISRNHSLVSEILRELVPEWETNKRKGEFICDLNV